MATIDAETRVALSMKQLLASAGAVILTTAGVCWAMLTTVTGPLRDDLKETRAAVHKVDKDAMVLVHDTNKALNAEIAKLTLTVMSFSDKMDGAARSADNLSKQMEAVQRQLVTRASFTVDPKAVAEAIAKSGLPDGTRMIFVPYEVDRSTQPK